MENVRRLISLLENSEEVRDVFEIGNILNNDDIIDFGKNSTLAYASNFYRNKLDNLLKTSGLYETRDYFYNSNHKEIVDLRNLIGAKQFSLFDKAKHDISILRELVYLYVLLMMYACTGYYKVEFKTDDIEKETKEYEWFVSGNSDHYFWYRGVSKINYDLLPSLYRGIDREYVHIDDDYIADMYKKDKRLDDYNNIFGKTCINNEFMAFMQHSCCLSPLLDFSSNVNVAGVFATNSNYDSDGAIYFATVNRNVGNPKKRDIEFFKNKLNCNSVLREKKLYRTVLSDFSVKYVALEEKTNDRMRYQDGLFIDIKSAVFVNKHIMFPDSKYHLMKFCFKSGNKKIINELITNKYEYYKYDYLMNPYLWFEKQ